MQNRKILILGVGNTLLRDEGFGVRAVQYLQENYAWPDNVTLMDGGTRGLLLMSEFMDCDFAVILDVAMLGEAPGAMYRMDGKDLPASLQMRQSAHQTSVNDILISCDLAGHRPDTLIMAFEPFDYQTVSAELSPEAQKLLPEFCAKTIEELRKVGIEPDAAKTIE